MKGEPARQRFGPLAQEIGRGASEDQVASSCGRAVHQNPQHGEEVRPALHLVDDDEPVERAERKLRLLEASEIIGIFQVEARDRAGPAFREHPGESRLPDLARSEDCDQRVRPEKSRDPSEVAFTWNHEAIILEFRALVARFSRKT